MRPLVFLIIATIVGMLTLAGCTKIESPEEGRSEGIRFGFVEKEKMRQDAEERDAKPPEPPAADVGSAAANETNQTESPVEQEAPQQTPPLLHASEDIQNDSQGNGTLLPDEETNSTGTNTTGEAPATAQNASNASSEDQGSDRSALGFEIRVDANRYYRDGAVRCHNSSLPQCVHIRTGPQGCGAACYFDPEAIMVPVGTTIEWGNHDTVTHQIIAQDESFISNLLEPVVSVNWTYPNYAASHFSFVFNTPGEYRYQGEQGSGLNGVVVVVTALS